MDDFFTERPVYDAAGSFRLYESGWCYGSLTARILGPRRRRDRLRRARARRRAAGPIRR